MIRVLFRTLIQERIVLSVIVLNAVAAFLHAFQAFPPNPERALLG